jgi:hypothetical protein
VEIAQTEPRLPGQQPNPEPGETGNGKMQAAATGDKTKTEDMTEED